MGAQNAFRPFLPSRCGELLRVVCPPDLANKLDRIIHDAGYQEAPSGCPINLDDLYRDTTAEVVQNAISWFVHRKLYSTPIPEFRAMVRSKEPQGLRKALETLVVELADNDFVAPWSQMRAEYTGGNLFAEGLAGDGEVEKEAEWERLFHPRILKQAIEIYLRLMDDLEEKTHGRRPPQVPEQMFVETLVRHWTENLELPLKNGRGAGTKQQGAVAEFVREVLDFYRLQLPTFPEEIRERLNIGPMDGHIRAAIDKFMAKSP